MKARIVVNKHHIKWNKEHPTRQRKVLSIQRSGHKVIRTNSITVKTGTFVYSPDKPLKCGATVWFETNGLIEYE